MAKGRLSAHARRRKAVSEVSIEKAGSELLEVRCKSSDLLSCVQYPFFFGLQYLTVAARKKTGSGGVSPRRHSL